MWHKVHNIATTDLVILEIIYRARTQSEFKWMNICLIGYKLLDNSICPHLNLADPYQIFHCVTPQRHELFDKVPVRDIIKKLFYMGKMDGKEAE